MTQHGIREVFSSSRRFDVHIYTEYLDEARFGSSEQEENFANYLLQKYSRTEPHAIIAVYPKALDFLIDERPRTFSGIPIVATEIPRDYAAELEKSPHRGFVTGTVVGDNVGAMIDTILRLRPGTKRVALVSGISPNDVYGERLVRSVLGQYAGRFDLIGLTALSMDETLARVGSLPGDAAVLYESILRDATGEDFVPRQALSRIARASTVPVFGLYDSFLGFGIVGGPLVSFEQHGRAAAALVLRVLAGEAPVSIPLEGEHTYVDAYDWRELKRWNISEEAFPAGSEIRYRVSTFWEEHGWIALGAALAFLVQSLLLLGLLTNIRKRRRAQDSLGKRENELRILTGRLINAQEEELQRLARELHDDLTQRLAALAIDAGVLAKLVSSSPLQAPEELRALREGLVEVSNDVHNLSRQLHPTILDDLGLVRASEAECELFRRRTGIDVVFESGNVPPAIPKDVALCLYRVMQEALRNIEKHSRASEARVGLEGWSQGLRLSIRDRGIGFDAQKGKGDAGGIGLSSMRERVRLVNGTLSIVSEPGKGTEVQVTAPVGEGADGQATGPDR